MNAIISCVGLHFASIKRCIVEKKINNNSFQSPSPQIVHASFYLVAQCIIMLVRVWKEEPTLTHFMHLYPSPLPTSCTCIPHPYPLHALVFLTLTHFMHLYSSPLPTSCTCIPHPYPLHALVFLTLTHFMHLYPSPLPTSCACIPHTYPLHALASWVSNCYLSQDRPLLHLVHTYPDLILLSTPIVYPFGDTVGCLCTSLPGIYEQLCKTLSLAVQSLLLHTPEHTRILCM